MSRPRAVIAIINYDRKVLIGKKKEDSSKFFGGKWHIPGETVEVGESDADALMRGMIEEASLEIRVGKYLASHVSPTGKDVVWYECFSDNDVVSAGSDIVELKWVRKADVPYQVDGGVVELWDPKIREYFS
jgi:NADH pyrophosphatase NudC (nudix superfamily)